MVETGPSLPRTGRVSADRAGRQRSCGATVLKRCTATPAGTGTRSARCAGPGSG